MEGNEVGDVVDDLTTRGKAMWSIEGFDTGSKKVNEDTPSAFLTRHEVERNESHATRMRNRFSSDVEVEQGAAHRALNRATKERGSVDRDPCSGFDRYCFRNKWSFSNPFA